MLSVNKIKKLYDQDFYQLRNKHCANKTLFEDPKFQAAASWKRPGEIVVGGNPQFFGDKNLFPRYDVRQGQLADCWLISGIINVTLHKILFQKVVPEDQGFDENYAGIFHFRIWWNGERVDVVIDDRLPTEYNKLIYAQADNNVFWCPLFEKAIAKLYGSYIALNYGLVHEAMVLLTGGPTESIELKTVADLSNIITEADEYSSLMTATTSTNALPDIQKKQAEAAPALAEVGLVANHAYSIVEVNLETQVLRLGLRLRDPSTPTDSEKCHNFPGCQFISDSPEKLVLHLKENKGVEFYMCIGPFKKYFTSLEICHLHPDCQTGAKKWELTEFRGKWGVNDNLESLICHPEYQITLTEADAKGLCTIFIALIQTNSKKLINTTFKWLSISFKVSSDNLPVDKLKSAVRRQELGKRFQLKPGTYVIAPSLHDQDQNGEFVLKVLTKNKITVEDKGDTSN